MADDLERFVASLAIPADRKVVVLAELTDHVATATEAALRGGQSPDAAAAAGRAALGDLEALRRSIEAVEPAFRISRRRAVVHALAASVGVIAAYKLAGDVIGPFIAVALVALLAPPRALALLRAELRAPRIRGTFGGHGVPIGPIVSYAYLVISLPVLFGIVDIFVRGYFLLPVNVPLSRFAVVWAVVAVVVVEAIRARRRGAVA